jgi:hypothetical protein
MVCPNCGKDLHGEETVMVPVPMRTTHPDKPPEWSSLELHFCSDECAVAYLEGEKS